jgi:outer membrane lipoprotein-sorting protein
MKKITFLLACAAFIMLSFTVNSQEDKRDEILQKHFETIGQEKLEDIKTLKMEGKSVGMGREFPFTMYVKEPNKMRNEIKMQGQMMVQAFDGENGWMIAPWMSPDPQDLTGKQLEQFKESTDIKGELYDWKEKGHELEYVGEEEMEGTPVYKLRLKKKNGDVIDYFIDKDSYILLKQSSTSTYNNQEVEVETYFSNYKMIEGVAIPMSLRTSFMGNSSQIQVDTIEFGVEIDDKMFKKPVSETKETEDSTK